MLNSLLIVLASVTLYTTPWCGNCKEVKEVLKSNCIQYKEVNAEESNPLNLNVIPVLVVGGKQYVGSPSIEAWAKANNQCYS